MPLTVKLDENLPGSMAELMMRHGYETATVKQQGWGGMKDELLWPRIAAEGRFFITADKGFGDIRKFPPGTHPGILLLRLDKPGVESLSQLMAYVLSLSRLELLSGSVSVATKRGLRVRRARPPAPSPSDKTDE